MTEDRDALVICDGPAGGFRVLHADDAFAALAGRPAERISGAPLPDLIAALAPDGPKGLSAMALSMPQPISAALRLGPRNAPQVMRVDGFPAPPGAAPPAVWVIRLRAGDGADVPPASDPGFADTLPVGLVLFDSEDRLTWFNATYAAVLGPNAPLLRLGEAFADIMGGAYRAGHADPAAGDIEARIAERLARHRNHETFIEALSGGRKLTVREIATGEGGTLGVRTPIPG